MPHAALPRDASCAGARTPARRPRAARGGVALLALLVPSLLLGGCGAEDRAITLGAAQPVTQPPPAPPPGAGDAQRLGRGGHGAMGGGSGEAAAPGRRWGWTTPEGWEEAPVRPMTEAVWAIPSAPGVDCTFSTAGGRLLDNVNRWRGQMELPPIDEAALAALPRVPMLGASGVLLDLSGTFVGMRSKPPAPGSRFLGLLAEIPGTLAALRLVGPADAVGPLEPAFRALAASLRVERGGAPAPEGLPPAPTGQAPLAWTLPATWEQKPNPGGGIRLATFGAASSKDIEITLTVLGGGVRPNLDVWRGQLGLPPITDAEFEALERGPVLGAQGTYCSFAGRLDRLGDAPAHLLGLIVERGRSQVFVKLTGPAEEVVGERERFRAFCESLRD